MVMYFYLLNLLIGVCKREVQVLRQYDVFETSFYVQCQNMERNGIMNEKLKDKFGVNGYL
jgi:hypothetical protein